MGVIETVAPRWYELGIELLNANQSSHLDVIAANDHDVIKCCYAMFRYWLESHPKASWKKLVHALKAEGVGENYEASIIESKFVS